MQAARLMNEVKTNCTKLFEQEIEIFNTLKKSIEQILHSEIIWIRILSLVFVFFEK